VLIVEKARVGVSELTKDDKDIVSALRAALADRVGKERFELWFGPRTRIEWDRQILRIAAPNSFFLDWIRLNFRAEIEAAATAVMSCSPKVEFALERQGDKSDNRQQGCEGPHAGASAAQPAVDCPAKVAGNDSMVSLNGQSKRDREIPATVVTQLAEPAADSRAEQFTPRKFASLSSFVVGPCNKLAMYSAEMVVRNPGKVTPLFIHGPTSVGKTHLLEGIWSAERKAGRGTTTVYLSAEQFTSQFLEALRGGGLPVFRRKHRGVRVLILDDFHFLAGKRATQVEMMHTVETLLREGRQLVFAADRPPAEFKDFMPELVTRLSGGMVCRIEPPEFSTRMGIVANLCRRLGVELPADVQRYVATQFTGHARELSGAICRLQAMSEATHRKLTLELAEEALCEMIRQNSRVVRLSDIDKAVCKLFGLESQSLQSSDKCRRVSQPRMLAMWLARKHTRAALSEISAFFGRRSHSAVISAQKRVDQWMVYDEPISLHEQTWKIDEAIRMVERQLTAG
jgi:chromosomal replication initiator protein